MSTIGYQNIEDVILSLQDPNTGGAISNVPGVSSPKINGATSVYNVEAEGGLGIAGWSTDAKWTAGVGSISWTSGSISLPDGNQISISSGSATVTAPTYIYVDMEDGTVYSTTHSYEAVGENKIMICAAFPNSGKNVTYKAFGCADQNSLTTGSDIASGTITANNIASNTITASQIASGTITANEIAGNTITASEIASGAINTSELAAGAVTASKISVSELSAIVAKLGDVYVGDKNYNAIRIYPYSSDTGRIDFYYNGSVIGHMRGQYNSNIGAGAVTIDGTYINLAGQVWNFDKVFFGGKLRIPVGTNLYG